MFSAVWSLVLALTTGGSGVVTASTVAPVVRPTAVTCPEVLIPPVVVTVRNERGLVLGREVAGVESYRQATDTLKVSFRKGPDGRYTVTAGKRWYHPTTVRGIVVKEGPCGPVRPTRVNITLRPQANAPLIRDFQIRSTQGDASGSWPAWTAYRVFLDAPASVSRAVTWTSSRPDVATIDRLGVLRTKCLKTRQDTVITATLKADPTKTASARYSTGSAAIDCRHAPR